MKCISTSGSQNDDLLKDSETYSSDTEVKSFHQPTEVDSDLKGNRILQDPDDSVAPETPKSTAAEAPNSPCDMQTDIDPQDDNQHNQKSPELISPSDGHLEGFSVQEPTSSGFESESGADEPETHISDDLKQTEGEGFTIEHRKSPPVQPVYFKPIHTFSDTNPFGVLDNLTSPNAEKESSLIETCTNNLQTSASNEFKTTDCFVNNKSDLLFGNVQEAPANFQISKEKFEFETLVHENSFSTLCTEQHTTNERDEHLLTFIHDESRGTGEHKHSENIISKDDDLLTTGDKAETIVGNNTCSFESKDEVLETSEFKESKVEAGAEPLEIESDTKLKGNIFNTITGLEFETAKHEFDDKVSDIIFGSRDAELSFDSGKTCDIESVINSSEHHVVQNFEEIQFDTSKSNNKLESKCLDIHFGTDDIEFENDFNDYNLTNKSKENSVPCKETEDTVIDKESKLVDNEVKNDNDGETGKSEASSNIEPVEFSVNSISSEISTLIQNIEVLEKLENVEYTVDYIKDSVIPLSKEHDETSVSSAVEEFLNQSENSITEFSEDQIVNSKVTAVFDVDNSSPDLFCSIQDVHEKIGKESNEDRKLGEESHKDNILVDTEKELSNIVETEICSDFVKEVETASVPFIQPELTECPLTIEAADKMEDYVSYKAETNNLVNLKETEAIPVFETAVNTRPELVQDAIPEVENKIISQVSRNEKNSEDVELIDIIQYESSVLVENTEDTKANKEVIETVLSPATEDNIVDKEHNQNSEFCELITTEVQELSKHVHVQTQKSLHFEETTSSVSEVVIPTLNETCVMPVTAQEISQLSNDEVLKPVNETQLELQPLIVEQTSQNEENEEIPSVTETPPPTPAPGIASEKEDRKEGLLAAAAAAAGKLIF